MLERAKKADASDRAVVMASYLKLIQKGIEGEITPEKLADFHEAYEIAESHIDAKLRQPTEAKQDDRDVHRYHVIIRDRVKGSSEA